MYMCFKDINQVCIPGQESERSCICVLGISIKCVSQARRGGGHVYVFQGNQFGLCCYGFPIGTFSDDLVFLSFSLYLVFHYFYFIDIRRINNQAVYALNTGMIIIGGGVIKHHICNANLMVRIIYKAVCIPMGTNCALLLADLFLYLYEANFLQGLHKKTKRSQPDTLITRSAIQMMSDCH